MRITCEDLALGYQVWRTSPRTLIGFMPRIHLRKYDGLYEYRCWWKVWWEGTYSIILTKAAFLHHDFFNLYTYVMPQSIRDLVDERMNCEDIAMQFLISNHTSLPPLYIKGNLQDLGALNGISTKKNVISAGHMDERSQCLNELVKSHVIIGKANDGWFNSPSTWYEYISSDLWKF